MSSNTQSVFELIDQCDFKVQNPFDLYVDLYDSLTEVLPSSLVKLLTKKVYDDWLVYIFSCESEGSIFYGTIIDKIKNGYLSSYYGHLSNSEIEQFEHSFLQIINDELKHRSIFLEFMQKIGLDKKLYKPEYYDPTVQELIDSQTNIWNELTFLELFTNVITGECYFMTTFYMMYKNTTNPTKKLIMKELVKDESRHIVHFMKFLQKAKLSPIEKIIFQKIFLSWTKLRLNFEQKNFKDFLHLVLKDKSKLDTTFDLAYKSEFHKNFKQTFLKKSWQFFNVVFPEVDQTQFEHMVA